jgi:chorismate mutase
MLNFQPTEKLDLTKITKYLEILEDQIIFKILQRAQYKLNQAAYNKGLSGFDDYPNLSLLEIRLRYQEEVEARFGRYLAPQEQPFSPKVKLPKIERRSFYPENALFKASRDLNFTASIFREYLQFLPKICQGGSDEHLGSSVEHDVLVLQTLAERIHFAAFYVSEAKYQEDKQGYKQLIAANDYQGIAEKLTRPAVEKQIIERIVSKGQAYQQVSFVSVPKVNPKLFGELYREVIIPLTKKAEVEYFLARKID